MRFEKSLPYIRKRGIIKVWNYKYWDKLMIGSNQYILKAIESWVLVMRVLLEVSSDLNSFML